MFPLQEMNRLSREIMKAGLQRDRGWGSRYLA